MEVLDLARRIEFHRGAFANPRKLQSLCEVITTNGAYPMVELCYRSKIVGINKIAMFCNNLTKEDQEEMVVFINTKPKAKYIDLKYQEILLRK